MLINAGEAEDLCIALLQFRDGDGKLTAWGSDMSIKVFRELRDTGRVVFELKPENCNGNER